MSAGDTERCVPPRPAAQERARQAVSTDDTANLKAPLGTPLFVALVALGLLLVGVLLGATGAQLAYGWSAQGRVPHREISSSGGPPRRIRASSGRHEELHAQEATPTEPTLRAAEPHHHPSKRGHSTRSLFNQDENMESLESIMYHYRTDKSKDDKKYSDLYGMLFDPIRLKVRNVTEVGMGDGGCTVAWHDYFRKAQIYGMDKSLDRVRNYLNGLPRIHMIEANPADASFGAFGLLPSSMDVVFESAGKGLKGQQQILLRMWHLVRPGGYYIIEDVGWDKDGTDQRAYPLIHQPYKLSKEVREIFEGNDAFFADTTLGHRAWEDYIREVPEDLNHFSHNAHVIVIKKRTEPLRSVTVNTRNFVGSPIKSHSEQPLYQRRQQAWLGLA